MTVKSSRSAALILPYMTVPTCSATTISSGGSSAITGSSARRRTAATAACAAASALRAAVGIVPPFLDLEHREDAIADEFEDFPAVIADCNRLRVEERVEDLNHPIGRQSVPVLGEAAKVRRPQNGA
jgi:hypothetical protein